MSPHEHARISYGQQWKALLSKKHNVLKPFVTYKGDCSGRYATVDNYGELELDEKTARHENSPAVELPTGVRYIFPKSFNKKVKFDEDDDWKLDRLGVPMPQAAIRLMQAGERQMEQIIVDGMLNTMKIGDGAEESMTTIALPSTQIVNVDFEDGATNTNLTVAKILEALRIFMENEAWGQDSVMDEPDQLCMAASPSALLKLWTETTVTNDDFRKFAGHNTPYNTGVLENFLGIKIMVTTRTLPLSGTTRSVPVWLKSKVTYGDWKRAETDVWRDRDTGGDRIRFKFTGGASRTEEEGVVKILCDESA